MLKWYQETERQHDVFVAGRVRLVRNLEHYPFPLKLSEEEGAELVRKMELGLKNIGSVDDRKFKTMELSSMDPEEKDALKERRAINGAGAEKKGPESLMLSEDEIVSITPVSYTHLRAHET